MSKHEPTGKHESGDQPTQDEVAKKAYAIYVKEGRPQGHAEQNWADAEAQLQHAGAGTFRATLSAFRALADRQRPAAGGESRHGSPRHPAGALR